MRPRLSRTARKCGTADSAPRSEVLRPPTLRQNRMAHASELLEQIARSRLRYVEVPVTIEYSDYALAKGQKSVGSIGILVDLLMGVLQR